MGTSSFYGGAGDLNSSLPAYIANTVTHGERGSHYGALTSLDLTVPDRQP